MKEGKDERREGRKEGRKEGRNPPTHSPPRRQTCFHSIHVHPSFTRPHRSPATHRSPSFPSCFGCTGQRTSGNCRIYTILRPRLRLFHAPCRVCSCLPASMTGHGGSCCWPACLWALGSTCCWRVNCQRFKCPRPRRCCCWAVFWSVSGSH